MDIQGQRSELQKQAVEDIFKERQPRHRQEWLEDSVAI